MSTQAFKDQIDKKIGGKPKDRVYFYPESLEGEPTEFLDLTTDYIGLSRITQEKERNRGEIASGDVQIKLNNTDNKFSDKQPTSIFFGEAYYINRPIELYKGMVLLDGTTEYALAMTCEIVEIEINPDRTEAFLLCQDISKDIVAGNINVPTAAMVPTANAGNTGDGTMTEIATLPFSTLTENWTLTCDLGGGSGVATFTVIGSVSGNIGTTTVGNEFESESYGIRFIIYAGAVDFVIGDIFTFSTRQFPQYTDQNLVDVIEDVLTDTIYGLGIPSAKIDSASFATAAANVGIGTITGYVPFNTNAALFIKDLLRLTFGSIWTGTDGKINVFIWKPVFGTETIKEYNRNDKITSFKYNKRLDTVVNQITVKYREQAAWAWSDEGQELDGLYYDEETTSISRYGKRPYPLDGVLYSMWISSNDAQWIASRVLDKDSEPVYVATLETRLDAIEEFVGILIFIVETDSNFT